MTFLNPVALLGLAAAAIPALLHLFERRTPPAADFPPFRYLREADRQSARRLKLQQLLLLLLRTALIALVVMAAARPVVPIRAHGAHEPTALVVILDNSPSSGAVVDGRPVLDRLRAVARASFAAVGAGDRVWLVLADGVARRGSGPALLAAVDGVTTSPLRLDLTAALGLATRIVGAERVTAREVHLLSDLQRTAFGRGRVTIPSGVRVLILAPGAGPPANRGIGWVAVADGMVSVPLVGAPGVGPAAVMVQIGGRVVGRALATPPAGVGMALPRLGVGWWVGEATLDPDEMRSDDRRLFVWHVARPTGVSVSPDAGAFLEAATSVLRDAQRIAHGNEVTVGGRPGGGRGIVFPPPDQASLGELNRALAVRGSRWRFGARGTPGPIATEELGAIAGGFVARRQRLELGDAPRGRAAGADSSVLASVNGEPWLVRDNDIVLVGSRLDTAWTALPRAPAFVPFVDALINRIARGEVPVRTAEGAARVEFESRGADTVGATIYGGDPRESDLTPAPADLVEEALGAPALDETRWAAARFSGRGRAEASGWVLALALLVACVELGVATFAG